MLFQVGPFYLFLSATAIAAGLMLGLILVSILACDALVGLRIPSEIFTPRVKKNRKSLQLSRDHEGRVHGTRCGTLQRESKGDREGKAMTSRQNRA
jgi:hypothetical protein